MDTKKQPSDDLRAIRQMMEQSSKFLSLSGLSGISAGVIAIIGSAIAYFLILDFGTVKYDEFLNTLGINSSSNIKFLLVLDGLMILAFAILAAWYFSWRNCKKKNQIFMNASTKNLIKSLVLVLMIGGTFSVILFFKGYFKLVAPTMLIFYGLSLINASKYSHRDIKQLGYLEVITGLVATVFIDYSLFFWTLGFGVFHILYGSIMYFKYDLKPTIEE